MQKNKSTLAILGGKKTISIKSSHYVWPKINNRIKKVVIKQLETSISIYNRSGIFEKFEKKFAKYHNRKHALLCSSGTLAIHSMFVAAGFKDGDEVICPVYTFFATVSPLLFTGAKPIFCDIDENGNIDPMEIEKRITRKTKGVIVTHMWGYPCQMNRIVDICKKNNLLLLEDCSHAHGASINRKKTGSFGDLAAWSLQGQKNVTGGEGGILVTDNKNFYDKALLLGHYNKRCKQELSENSLLRKYCVTGMGLKYRAHPLAISIAYEMFMNMDKYLATKTKFAKKITEELKGLEGFIPLKVEKNVNPSWYGMIFKYKKEKFSNLSLEKFFKALKSEGLSEVDIPESTSPLNLLPLFQTPWELFPVYSGSNKFSYKIGDFPKAENFYKTIIKIPVWAFMSDNKIVKDYIKGIKKVCDNYKDILYE